MNKRGWTIEQILELTEKLHKHHEDYGQGKIQDVQRVCESCNLAAEIIIQLLDNDKENEELRSRVEILNMKLSDAELRHGDLAVINAELEKENRVLKAQMEVVRMFLGKER